MALKDVTNALDTATNDDLTNDSILEAVRALFVGGVDLNGNLKMTPFNRRWLSFESFREDLPMYEAKRRQAIEYDIQNNAGLSRKKSKLKNACTDKRKYNFPKPAKGGCSNGN
ncbi:hypothetical protein RAC89_19155 [Paenibacillus sp. GD4]|uniref:hypothetical protein n=1 Tax=Paenibacillus sp. GD4 TaxID=3068890 RepID=UPI00279678A4|nr:hypothetical protein [Paenibacillus sp. GD4]MDQ1912515.1 hypothetical protein [Paenibacillus sp. GD4]